MYKKWVKFLKKGANLNFNWITIQISRHRFLEVQVFCTTFRVQKLDVKLFWKMIAQKSQNIRYRNFKNRQTKTYKLC